MISETTEGIYQFFSLNKLATMIFLFFALTIQ